MTFEELKECKQTHESVLFFLGVCVCAHVMTKIFFSIITLVCFSPVRVRLVSPVFLAVKDLLDQM